MRRISCLLLIVALLLVGGPAPARPVHNLKSRTGDNTIYFRWNADTGSIEEATSSVRFRARAKVELLTRLRIVEGHIRMRARLKNIAKKVSVRLRGRFVHKVWDENGERVARLPSQRFRVVLRPGEWVWTNYHYRLPTGTYSARTDFRRMRNA